MGILDFLMMSKIFPSKAEVRRLVQQGGISIDGEKISDPKTVVQKSQFLGEDGVLLKKGKKHYFNIKVR